MSTVSTIYSANTSTQTLTTNTPYNVNFGSVVRRCGDALTMSGGNIVISECGFYSVDINIGCTVTSGTITVQIFKDGTLVPGATSTIMSGATTTDVQTTIPFMVRNKCCCDSTLSCVVTSTAGGTITNATIRVIEDEED